MKKQALILLLLPLFACTEKDRNSQGEDFTSNVNKVGEPF